MPTEQVKGDFMYGVLCFLFSIFRLPRLKLRVVGLENLPSKKTKFLVVANHDSKQDPWVISCILKRHKICWYTSHELFYSSFYRKILFNFENNLKRYVGSRLSSAVSQVLASICVYCVQYHDVVPVNRFDPRSPLNIRCIRVSRECYRKGKSIGIFPEGGVERKTPEPNFRGIVLILRACPYDVLPIRVNYETREVVIHPPIPSTDFVIGNKVNGDTISYLGSCILAG